MCNIRGEGNKCYTSLGYDSSCIYQLQPLLSLNYKGSDSATDKY